MSLEARSTGNGAGCPFRPRRSWNVGPNLPHGSIVLLRRQQTGRSLQRRRLPVRAGLSHAKNKLHIILNDAVGFIRLAQGRAGSTNFRRRVGDLVPKDCGQPLETDLTAANQNVRMKRNNFMFDESLAGTTHIANDDAKSPSRDQFAEAFPHTLSSSLRNFS